MRRTFLLLGLKHGLLFLALSGLLFPVGGFFWWLGWALFFLQQAFSRQFSGAIKFLSLLFYALAAVNLLLLGQVTVLRLALAIFFSISLWWFEDFFRPAALDKFSLRLRRFGQTSLLLLLLAIALLDAFYLTLNTNNLILLVWPLLLLVLFATNEAFWALHNMSPGRLRVFLFSFLQAEFLLLLYFLPASPWYLAALSLTCFLFSWEQMRDLQLQTWQWQRFVRHGLVVLVAFWLLLYFSGVKLG